MEQPSLLLAPYCWAGPYADMRTANGWPHDPGLCATLQGGLLPAGEQLTIRAAENVYSAAGHLYDDHFPPCDPDGYRHTSLQWDDRDAPQTLQAECGWPGRATLRLTLAVQGQSVRIELAIRNGSPGLMSAVGSIRPETWQLRRGRLALCPGPAAALLEKGVPEP